MSLMLNREQGASLIEVMVALLIFTVGLLGLAAMQLTSLQSVADSGQRSQSVWLLQDFVERMRANPAGTPAQYAAAANCAALPNPMCADYFNPNTNTKVNGSQCSATQMAAFDVWEARCSYTGVANFNPNDARFNSRDYITVPAQGALIDTTVVGGDLVLSINWANRSATTTTDINNNRVLSATSDGSTSDVRILR
ncbi:pilus assembly protein PilV [Pseudomonas sp. TTU2014-080ASC]|nr:pilus assembly protein PilV [Pseudomonas sp. TTU2014-080ASC]